MTTQQNRPFVSLTGAITMILGMVVLFYLAKGIFTILAWLAPVLLIAALVINRKVVVNYGLWIFNQFRQRNWLVGVGASLLTVFAFPFVAFFLFGKALFMKKIADVFPQAGQAQPAPPREDDFVEYEEIVDETLELPDLPKETQNKIDNNDYENLF